MNRHEWEGKTYTTPELARHLGLKYTTLQMRILNGWPKEHWCDPVQWGGKRRGSDYVKRSTRRKDYYGY